MRLWSETHNLTGRADAVEFHDDGRVVPIEYKAGRRHGDAADIQLCAQAICLEEMLGTEVPVGYLWLAPTRRRVRIPLDARLRSATLTLLAAIAQALESGQLPPAPDDRRCAECQLQGYCLPGVVARPEDLQRYEKNELLRCGA
jgi:CRISPR-associated exonuclease Cas4